MSTKPKNGHFCSYQEIRNDITPNNPKETWTDYCSIHEEIQVAGKEFKKWDHLTSYPIQNHIQSCIPCT